jgi:mannose-1-phosphate guanylyltransferase
MLPIGGIPHLEYQIRLLSEHGFKDIIFSTGYLHNQIIDYFGNGHKHGVIIRYKEDGPNQLGTGGAIKNCLDMIDGENVLVLNGDILTNINLSHMKEAFLSKVSTPIMMALTPVSDPTQYGVAKLATGGKIIDFIEKPQDNSHGNLINAGIYMMNKAVIENNIDDGFSMVENSLFPKFASTGMLGSYIGNYYWLDIGTHERYQQAQNDVQNYF